MYILASDYDGTLNRDGISDTDRAAIARFRAAGNLFGIVTGRDWNMFEIMRRQQLELDFLLAMNGAMLIAACGPRAGEILRCERQKNDGCLGWIVEHVGKKYGYEVRTVLEKEAVVFHAAHPDGNERYAPLSRTDPTAPDGIREFSQMNTRCETSEDARRCVEEINAAWGQTVRALQNSMCIDIPPVGFDKGEGVALYAAQAGVPPENVYCAGDQMNDYAMIARFHGLAVENAAPALKAAAEGVFPDVAAMIDHIMGKEGA